MTQPLQQHISSVTLLVNNYDEAIEFYTQKLQFKVLQDQTLEQGKRWLQLAPANSTGINIILMKAETEQQQQLVGNQAGGAVLFILQTNNFWRDYQYMHDQGVEFTEQPREELYGTVAIFKDLYGNLWDLLQIT